MAHTLPDYSTKYRLVKLFGQIDSGELAARLKSCDTFDRRGNVIYMDDFEDGTIKYWASGTGGRGSSNISNTAARSGATSLLMTTGALANDIYSILKGMPVLETKYIGAEISFAINDTTGYVEIGLGGYLNGYNFYSEVRFNIGTRTLSYYDTAGAHQPFATSVGWWSNISSFFTLKMVIDTTTHKYVRAIWGDDTYDLSNYNYSALVSANPDWMWVSVDIQTLVAAPLNVYIDDLIVTVNDE